MKFSVGDTVMHRIHGLGQVTGLEEHQILGEKKVYYVVEIRDLHIWVPADELVTSRIRPPTSARAFRRLLTELNGPAESLPDGRRERKAELHTRLTVGTATANCHLIRDLTGRQAARSLNEHDRSTLDQARAMLLQEWVFALEVSESQALDALNKILRERAARPAA